MTHIAITGSGQAVSHWTPDSGEPAPSPTTLRHAAAAKAIGARTHVDVVVVLRTTEDSIPTSSYPHGRDANPPGTLLRDLGITANEAIYHHSGGQSPQEVVNQLAMRMDSGDIASALIVSAEATGAAKAATRAGVALDWNDDAPTEFTDRGMGLGWLDPHELRHGLITPASYYGLMENALADSKGHDRAQHRNAMSGLFAPFSEVASQNAFAQFGTPRSVDFLSTPSRENYPVASPYLKWHVAQDAVNQGAATLLETGEHEGAIYLRGGADVHDAPLSKRDNIYRSRTMERAIALAFGSTDWNASELSHVDLYSCFPVAVWSAMDVLTGLPDIPLTLTGGLPYFGGPGNSYSLHAIAEMHAALSGTQARGLVLANGGWMSKESVGLYSGTPCAFAPVPPTEQLAPTVEVLTDGHATGKVETFTYDTDRKGVPARGTVFVRLEDGRRALASVKGGMALDNISSAITPIGDTVHIDHMNGIGTLSY